jgi:hypothetical protein
MTTPMQWTCEKCQGVNSSGPVVTEHADGGESWDLQCMFCSAEYPVARVSAHGVRLRDRLQKPMREGKRLKVQAEMKDEVTR